MLRRSLAILLLLYPFTVSAQSWPAPGRELKVVVGFPPGAGGDTSVRFYAAKLAEVSGHPVIVENRAGMLSSLGADAVAKSKPDGYTILLAPASSSHADSAVTWSVMWLASSSAPAEMTAMKLPAPTPIWVTTPLTGGTVTATPVS